MGAAGVAYNLTLSDRCTINFVRKMILYIVSVSFMERLALLLRCSSYVFYLSLVVKYGGQY